MPVPYDFDFAGMVDAPYATPPAAIPLSSVRVRRYRGYCRHNDAAITAAGELVAKRAQLLAVLEATPGLEAEPKRKAAAYLNTGFDQLAEPAKITAGCIG